MNDDNNELLNFVGWWKTPGKSEQLSWRNYVLLFYCSDSERDGAEDEAVEKENGYERSRMAQRDKTAKRRPIPSYANLKKINNILKSKMVWKSVIWLQLLCELICPWIHSVIRKTYHIGLHIGEQDRHTQTHRQTYTHTHCPSLWNSYDATKSCDSANQSERA